MFTQTKPPAFNFPKKCCIRCKYTPNIQPEDFYRFIGTTIPCKYTGEEVHPDEFCSCFTLPSNKDKSK